MGEGGDEPMHKQKQSVISCRIIYNMGMSGLPKISTCCPQACGPWATGGHFRADHECPCYNYYVTLMLPDSPLR